MNNLVGIEYILGIPSLFDNTKQLIVLVAHHLPYEFTAKPSIAMLATQRSIVLFNQRGNFFCYRPEQAVARLCF